MREYIKFYALFQKMSHIYLCFKFFGGHSARSAIMRHRAIIYERAFGILRPCERLDLVTCMLRIGEMNKYYTNSGYKQPSTAFLSWLP